MEQAKLSTLVDDPKLEVEGPVICLRAAIQRHLDRQEEWAVRNLLKFNKDKCQVLHLGETNTPQCYRLGPECLGSSSVEKDLRVLGDRGKT